MEQDIGSDNSKNEIPRVILGDVTPMRLDCGFELRNFEVAYKTYGKSTFSASAEKPITRRGLFLW